MTTVVFDFDGVILRGDSFGGYLRWRTRRHRWLLPLALPLLLLKPLLRYARTMPWTARLFLRVLTVGLDNARFEAEVDAFSSDWLQLERRINRPLLQRLFAHQAAGDRVVVASGTSQYVLDTLLHKLGVRDVTALGSQVAFDGWGLRASRHNFGVAKVQALAALGIQAPWSRSYSDSHSDLPLLAAAEYAVLVNPPARDEQAVRAVLGDRVEVLRC